MVSYCVEPTAISALWKSVLCLSRYLRETPCLDGDVVFVNVEGAWRLDTTGVVPPHSSLIVRVPLTTHSVTISQASSLRRTEAHFDYARFLCGQDPLIINDPTLWDRAVLSLFRIYLPLVLGPLVARQQNRAFVTAHLAQSLDGRIACKNGQSQWISCDADLWHAHRLRALHEGVLVGSGTVINDDPMLTVRHVEGESPRRIILNASASLLNSQVDYRIFEGESSLLLCSSDAANAAGNENDTRLSVIPFDMKNEDLIDPRKIREALYERGIHTIFVEGGAQVLSSFFGAGCVDVLHLAIAPMILGSGIPSLTLPEIHRVQEGHGLTVTPFFLDRDLLLECRPPAKGSQPSFQVES